MDFAISSVTKSRLGRRNPRPSQAIGGSLVRPESHDMVLRSNLRYNFKNKPVSNLNRTFCSDKFLTSSLGMGKKPLGASFPSKSRKSLFSNNALGTLSVSGVEEVAKLNSKLTPKIIVADEQCNTNQSKLKESNSILINKSEEEFILNEQSVLACISSDASTKKNVQFTMDDCVFDKLLTMLTEFRELKRAADLKWMQIEKVLKKLHANKENRGNLTTSELNSTLYSDEKLASFYAPSSKTPESHKIRSVCYTPKSLLKRLSEQQEELNQS